MASESNGEPSFLPHLFGDDGAKIVPLSEVKAFLASLHDDLAHLEFSHYTNEVTSLQPQDHLHEHGYVTLGRGCTERVLRTTDPDVPRCRKF